MNISKLIISGLIVISSIFVGIGYADLGDSSSSNSPLKAVSQLIEDGKFTEAIAELSEADQDDADVLNLLGYSNRKLKKFDVALEFYLAALAIEPKHKGANEYLGELYLETGKLEKSKERLTVLDDACFFSCSEYSDLKRAIEEYESKNSN